MLGLEVEVISLIGTLPTSSPLPLSSLLPDGVIFSPLLPNLFPFLPETPSFLSLSAPFSFHTCFLQLAVCVVSKAHGDRETSIARRDRDRRDKIEREGRDEKNCRTH